MNITFYSLSDYNNGTLIPQTFDLEEISSKEELLSAIHDWLREVSEEAKDGEIREEWIVADYEDIPSEFVGEWDLSDDFWEWKDVVENSYLNYQVFEAAAALDIPASEVEDCYQGEWDSEVAFAKNLVDELGYLEQMPEQLRYYFDYESFARDLFINDYVIENGHVFSRY